MKVSGSSAPLCSSLVYRQGAALVRTLASTAKWLVGSTLFYNRRVFYHMGSATFAGPALVRDFDDGLQQGYYDHFDDRRQRTVKLMYGRPDRTGQEASRIGFGSVRPFSRVREDRIDRQAPNGGPYLGGQLVDTQPQSEETVSQGPDFAGQKAPKKSSTGEPLPPVPTDYFDLQALDAHLDGGIVPGEALSAGPKFAGVKLSREDLQKLVDQGVTNFEGANFSGVNLDGMKLPRLNFTNAIFNDCSFKETDISDCDCKSASFLDAKLTNTKASRTNFSGADMGRAVLLYSNLDGANLCGATFQGGDHFGGSVDNVSVDAFSLDSAVKAGISLSRIRFLDIRQDAAGFCKIETAPRNLESANFVSSKIHNTNLAGRRLAGSDLSNSEFVNVDFKGADLSGANCTNTKFVNCDLRGTNFSGLMNFTNTDFTGSLIDRKGLRSLINAGAKTIHGVRLFGSIEGLDLKGIDLEYTLGEPEVFKDDMEAWKDFETLLPKTLGWNIDEFGGPGSFNPDEEFVARVICEEISRVNNLTPARSLAQLKQMGKIDMGEFDGLTDLSRRVFERIYRPGVFN